MTWNYNDVLYYFQDIENDYYLILDKKNLSSCYIYSRNKKFDFGKERNYLTSLEALIGVFN
jgi:hypothetical protein